MIFNLISLARQKLATWKQVYKQKSRVDKDFRNGKYKFARSLKAHSAHLWSLHLFHEEKSHDSILAVASWDGQVHSTNPHLTY
jgi:hypothetical protein